MIQTATVSFHQKLNQLFVGHFLDLIDFPALFLQVQGLKAYALSRCLGRLWTILMADNQSNSHVVISTKTRAQHNILFEHHRILIPN